MSLEPKSRMVGVSSAPARSFMDKAAGAGAGAGRVGSITASPTVLFTLLEERERFARRDSSDEDEVPIGGSRRAAAASVDEGVVAGGASGSAAGTSAGAFHMGGVAGALPPAHPRTARLSSGDYDSSDDGSSEDEDDLHFKLDV